MTSLGRAINRGLHVVGDRVVHLAARVGYATPLAQPSRYGVELHRDVPYGDGGKAHLADVYVPRRSPFGARMPLVVYVHGGGFAMLSKDTHRVMAMQFAARGYLVVNVNYRLGPRHAYPAPLLDVAQAVGFACAEAGRWGGDPARLVLAGESAGANLVTALTIAACVDRPEPFARALRATGVRPRATLPIYGLLDLTAIERFWSDRPLPRHLRAQIVHACEAYVGRPSQLTSLTMPLASPLRVLEELSPVAARELPPFFAAVGTADPLLDDTRRLGAALARLGVRADVVVHPGEIHGYNAMLFRDAARDMWRRAFDFVRDVLPSS
ncbi:MAG: alpha/beta hydrolase [Polyangiaceae bacterium]|nr:alpha/beta hydrolase [Polyangiaceae bacterium]